MNAVVATPRLTESWTLGPVTIPNRVVLAPLAGISNWFVRLQAKRHGAGLAVSEMISSQAVFRANERTCRELLRIDPREHPVSLQLFGADTHAMAFAAERVAAAGADMIDINMCCPVPKVCKTGAGAALLDDPSRAAALARAAADASGLPVTVKLRTGLLPGDLKGVALARELVERGHVAALFVHPRHASQRHSGRPDYDLAARLVEELPVPVLISGGMRSAARVRAAFAQTGAAGVLLARGSFGNPWLFEELLAARATAPTPTEILAELDWILAGAVTHLGEDRASRYLRRFYPWYVERTTLAGAQRSALQARLQQSSSTAQARALFGAALLAERP